MKLVAMLRVKNEMPVITECLDTLSLLVDEIVIADNGSTDGTLAAYSRYPKIAALLHTHGYQEGRDKNLLLEAARKRNPDWILSIDGDEVFEQALTRKRIEQYMRSRYRRISFRMCNFWLDHEKYRIDGPYFAYTLQPQRSMWRNDGTGYISTKQFHVGDIRGISGKTYVSPYRIKHYGYADKEKIAKKYAFYAAEDRTMLRDYRHLNPDASAWRIEFREFKNPAAHHAYLLARSYAAWTILQIRNIGLRGLRLIGKRP